MGKTSAGVKPWPFPYPRPLRLPLLSSIPFVPFPVPDQASDLGSAVSSPRGFGRSPADKRSLVHSELKTTLSVQRIYMHCDAYLPPAHTGMMFLSKNWRYGFEPIKEVLQVVWHINIPYRRVARLSLVNAQACVCDSLYRIITTSSFLLF